MGERKTSLAPLLALLLTGCPADGVDGGTPVSLEGGVVDSGPAPEDDAGVLLDGGATVMVDAGPVVIGDGGTSDGGDAPADSGLSDHDPGPPPVGRLLPTPGELSVIQLALPALNFGFSPPLGEAAILVGPDGTLTLLDVGNVMHDDDVRNQIRWLNEEVLTPARGYTARAPLQVEWIVLTHFHSDHIGGFERLTLDDTAPLVGVVGVVHRGFVGLGPSVTESDFEEVCEALRGTLAGVDVPLCASEVAAPCDSAAFTSTYPATECDGLPFTLPLGGSATLTIVAASGHVSDGTQTAALDFGVDDSNQENARSLAGVVAFGEFRYHFGGDMTGTGDVTEPDVEGLLVETAGHSHYGALGVDVAHAHHHARRTSSNAALVAALAPADGRARNVVAGINPAHLGSPHAEVLAAWADDNRLGNGRFWVTNVTLGGASHPMLEDADGHVVTQTFERGRGYWMQAVPNVGPTRARSFSAVRTSP